VYIVVQMDMIKIWQIINAFLNRPILRMVPAMEIVIVSQSMVKPLRTAPQIVDVATSSVNINLERHPRTVHPIVVCVEIINAIILKVVVLVRKIVALVKQNRHVAMEHVMGMKTVCLVQQIVALVR